MDEQRFKRMMKHYKLESFFMNGDICEVKDGNKIAFGIYINGYLYIDDGKSGISKYNKSEWYQDIRTIRRAETMNESLKCFKYGNSYNYEYYNNYGGIKIVYEDVSL